MNSSLAIYSVHEIFFICHFVWIGVCVCVVDAEMRFFFFCFLFSVHSFICISLFWKRLPSNKSRNGRNDNRFCIYQILLCIMNYMVEISIFAMFIWCAVRSLSLILCVTNTLIQFSPKFWPLSNRLIFTYERNKQTKNGCDQTKKNQI